MTRVSSGLYDVRRSPSVPARQIEFAFLYNDRLLQPLIGFIVTQTSDSYLYLGVLTDLPLFDPFRIAFKFAGGLYHHGRGIYLGYPFEFRSEAELIWNLNRRSSLGVGFAHLSNGALSGVNPGLEALLLSYYFVH